MWATGCHCPFCLVPTMLISTTLPLSICDLHALQACFTGLAGLQSPQTMMEGHKPDPLEGPWAWCHDALLCCMPSWRGTGSPCCSTAALGENISSLAMALGSSLFLRDARHASDISRNGQTFPSSSSSSCPRRGMAWQPVRVALQAL